jgi:cardiolipin synthase
MMLYDPSLTTDMRNRQDSYIAQSKPVTSEMVARWTWQQQMLRNNAVAMMGPVL